VREAESGETVVEVCRKYGISQQSYQNLGAWHITLQDHESSVVMDSPQLRDPLQRFHRERSSVRLVEEFPGCATRTTAYRRFLP
jgi:transposase-like protein